MIHRLNVDAKPRLPNNTFIRWITSSSPRPVYGLSNVLYVNKERKSISLWDESTGKYIEFFNGLSSTSVTTDNSLSIVNTNNNDSSPSFNLIDDSLIITNSDGTIVEISIPNEEAINEKINLLEERIKKLEELLS